MDEYCKYGIEVLKLPNGFEIFLKRIKTHRVFATLLVKCGSLHETKRNNGISHLLEHLIGEDGLIKDRRRRPLYRIERLGGEIDFETSQKFTEYHLETWLHCWRRSLGLFLKMIAEPRFSEANLEQERQVIVNEQQNERDEFDIALGRALFRNHPLALPIGGTRAVLSLTSRRVRRRHQRFYQPERMSLVAVGDIKMKHLAALVARSGFNILNNKKIIEEPPEIDIEWDKEYIITHLDINKSVFVYPLPKEPTDLVIFDHIANMLSDISTLSVNWNILRPLGLHEGLEIGANFNVCCWNLSASSQKVLIKLEKMAMGWLQRVVEKGISKDLYARTYKQAKSRMIDNFADARWWWESIRNMVSEGTLDAADAYFVKAPFGPNEMKKEMERVFRNVFGGKRVIVRSFVKRQREVD